MLTILFQSFISIDTLKHFVDVTRFVDEVGARTHEKAALQNPDLKKSYAKIFRSMCTTFLRDLYISLMHILIIVRFIGDLLRY